MADNITKQPKKGILKNSTSFDKGESQNPCHKETKWDEMNIMATLHPADKDYGHMKIEEPKTPFNYLHDEHSSDEGAGGLDAKLLAQKIQLGADKLPKALQEEEEEEESDGDPDETPEERQRRKSFEFKRKAHYNEFYAVRLARKLMEEEQDEDEEEDGTSSGGAVKDGT